MDKAYYWLYLPTGKPIVTLSAYQLLVEIWITAGSETLKGGLRPRACDLQNQLPAPSTQTSCVGRYLSPHERKCFTCSDWNTVWLSQNTSTSAYMVVRHVRSLIVDPWSLVCVLYLSVPPFRLAPAPRRRWCISWRQSVAVIGCFAALCGVSHCLLINRKDAALSVLFARERTTRAGMPTLGSETPQFLRSRTHDIFVDNTLFSFDDYFLIGSLQR